MTQYDLIIRPKRHAFDINFKEIWQYRDLLRMFVKRDVITVYKQTVLGPIWFIVQPILTTIIYMVVFGNIAKISTDGTPMALFSFPVSLSGTTLPRASTRPATPLHRTPPSLERYIFRGSSCH